MTKKILIALDDSQNAMRAVDFVCKQFIRDSEIELFSVLVDTKSLLTLKSSDMSDSAGQNASFLDLENRKKELIEEALKEGKRRLLDCGFAADSVVIKTRKEEKGVARDIITEAENGNADLIVLGKKGLSSIRDFFMGSVTQKVLHGVKEVSVLVVQ